MPWLWIAIGGGLGSVLRFWAQGRLQGAIPGMFPMGTLMVNLIGSAVIGFLGGCFAPGAPLAGQANLRLFLMVGILGGFTTFSSFSLENMTLLRSGETRLAVLYVLASNGFGIALAFGGYALARVFIRSGAGP
jgi:fluoride exporter